MSAVWQPLEPKGRDLGTSPYKSRACVASKLMSFGYLNPSLIGFNAAHAKSHALVLCGLFLLLTATMLVRVTDGGMGLRADRGEVSEILH